MHLIYYYKSYYGGWPQWVKKPDKESIWNIIVYVEEMNDIIG